MRCAPCGVRRAVCDVRCALFGVRCALFFVRPKFSGNPRVYWQTLYYVYVRKRGGTENPKDKPPPAHTRGPGNMIQVPTYQVIVPRRTYRYWLDGRYVPSAAQVGFFRRTSEYVRTARRNVKRVPPGTYRSGPYFRLVRAKHVPDAIGFSTSSTERITLQYSNARTVGPTCVPHVRVSLHRFGGVWGGPPRKESIPTEL